MKSRKVGECSWLFLIIWINHLFPVILYTSNHQYISHHQYISQHLKRLQKNQELHKSNKFSTLAILIPIIHWSRAFLFSVQKYLMYLEVFFWIWGCWNIQQWEMSDIFWELCLFSFWVKYLWLSSHWV